MGAQRQGRRKKTARELATQFGVTPRYIQMLIAEPREDWEARGRARQAEALVFRAEGLSYAEIGQRLGISRDAAAGLVRRGRGRQRTSDPSHVAADEPTDDPSELSSLNG